MVEPVRFAILGFGNHAVHRLLPGFARCERSTLVGAWRRDRAAAERDRIQHGFAHSFESAEALCASPEVDVVLITSPDARHKDDALLAMAQGKAVLCEKPMAMRAEEAQAMVRSAEAAGVLLGVAQNFRYNRSFERMREEIAAGRIGVPQTARVEFFFSRDKSVRRWIADAMLACGGVIGDVGVHAVDALRYVLAQEVVSVSTVARSDALSGELDAMASMMMEMSGGVFASAGLSGRAKYRTLLEVTGSEGALIAENGFSVDQPVELVIRRGGKLVETVTIQNADGYERMLDGFADAVLGGAAFRSSGADGVRNMQVLDAAYAGWRSGERVQVKV